MDLLHHRYASPFLLIDQFILVSGFSGWIDGFLRLYNQDLLWQVWLYKISEQGWLDFKTMYENAPQTPSGGSSVSVETIVAGSFESIQNFTI